MKKRLDVKQAMIAMLSLAATAVLSVKLVAEEPAADAAETQLAPIAPAVAQKIKQNIEAAIPGLMVQQVLPTKSSSFIEVQLNNGEVVYASSDGGHFVLGSMYEFRGNQLVNLTEEARNGVRSEMIANLDEQKLVVFKATGKEIAKINVFTDIDCGYCRKLHQEVPRLNEMGVTVRYLAYPRAGIMDGRKNFTPSFKKIKSVWCDKNPQAAMTKAKGTGYIKDNLACDAPIAEQYSLGQKMGVTGTPAIVLESGQLIPGYMKAEQLVARMNASTN